MSDAASKPPRLSRMAAALREALRRYFVAGVLVFAPVLVTAWAVAWIVQRLDSALLPHLLRLAFPGVEEPPRIPFVGALFTLLFILFLGVVARHLFGAEAVRLGERALARVPVARSIYAGVKQLLEALFLSQGPQGFRRVVLIEYPRKGIYAIAFTTGTARGVVQELTPGTMVNCFLPTTPNPTSGFYLLVPERELIEVAMSVEDAFKLIVSGGLVTPEHLALARGAAAEPAGSGAPPALPAALREDAP